MNATGQKWCRLAFLNFFLVSAAGVLLRLKILYSIPWLNFKFLLHAHSHFAFAGWVSLFLMAALVGRLPLVAAVRYEKLFLGYLVSAYGMLLSFPFQGYGPVSIFFSTISVLQSWWFAVKFWRDARQVFAPALSWLLIRWALFFLVISAAGTFSLAWLMANKVNHPDLYFGSIYFYLHFQYNGWFFFAILALLVQLLPEEAQKKLTASLKALGLITIPTYFLSTLWMLLPSWLYWISVVAAIVQMALFLNIVRLLYPAALLSIHTRPVKLIWLLALLALVIKFGLQTLSVIPDLSAYAFGFRPVVIGYLHLVLLGFVSLFCIGWLMEHRVFPLPSAKLPFAVLLFIAGILLNELTLMAQGITAMFLVRIPRTNEMLLLAALFLFLSIVWMNWQLRRSAATRPL
jgi:hypothetical protein